ncbi:hypothetical protein K7I13_10645 [Brucepastera parasyntrophica]|uniref:hypothetical protein n=1 Tax=Brucepastera parasyntrophica TaxID=2880008 RepID=UPI00210DA124|nr:hypothetical protein [Brucepastera parasyntrophica]ULQ58972.1 hypothetical protein K7I13_10645 [Brucepastera parasyntrophica]
MDDLGLDPELAALLDNTTEFVPQKKINKEALFSSASDLKGNDENDSGVNLNITSYTKIEKFLEDNPDPVFDDPDFYKKVLHGESTGAHRLHGLLSKYLGTKDPKDKSIFRLQLVSAYWEFASGLAIKVGSPKADHLKKMSLRYGLVTPSLLTAEQKNLFARLIETNQTNEAVYYIDEWVAEIGRGKINPSSTDEAKASRKDDSARFQQLLGKAQGRLQSAENLLRAKSGERTRAENDIKNKFDSIFTHESVAGLASDILMPYTDMQKRMMVEMGESLKKLMSIDKELQKYLADYNVSDGDVNSLQGKVDSSGGGVTNASGIAAEFDTIRQMAKMTCGRQGNHFPILSREYFHSSAREIGSRENVIEALRWIESIDPGAYCRQYKSQMNRIPPFVILIPSYGDTGFCWEPFDRYNRITSRGRIAVPMYAKNLTLAVLTAVADLRWQVAKEKASYYWMEEGLTGYYYQWFQAQKLKGDVKEYFINDYLTWILKESEGTQKLDKEVRAVFWRYMPYPPELKAKLKTRALVYQELCQRDANREMSDGY